jgi:hypothetical protein
MKNKLMLVGFGGVLAVILCFGSGQTTSPNTGGANGRFQMFSPQQSSGVTDIYVIDTQTGRIWRRILFLDVKGLYFAPQPYLTADELAVSAVPTDTVSLESLALQKKYEREIDQARQKKSQNPEK